LAFAVFNGDIEGALLLADEVINELSQGEIMSEGMEPRVKLL